MLNIHPKSQAERMSVSTRNHTSPEPTFQWANESDLRNTRTQELLVKWTEYQFKDNLKDIDVSTLVQLLKDIDNSNEIIEYVRPYMDCLSRAKEFAENFLYKRNQFSKIESNIDQEHLTELFMNSDDGFQLASSHAQKKRSKKLKELKLDSEQLGFTVNNAPKQRDDIDQIPM